MEKRIYKKPQTETYFPLYSNLCDIPGESRIDNGDGAIVPIVPGTEADDDWDEWDLSNRPNVWDED